MRNGEMGSEGWKLVQISQGQYKDAVPEIDDDKQRIYCCSGKDVFVYEAEEGRLFGRLRHFENVVGVQKHPLDESLVITCTTSGMLSIWSPKAEIVVKEFDLRKRNVAAFRVYSSDERDQSLLCYVVTFERGPKNLGLLFSVTVPLAEEEVTKLVPKFHCKEISRDSRLSSFSRNAFAWTHGKELYMIKFSKKPKPEKHHYHTDIAAFSSIAYHERGDILAAGDEMGRLLIWEKASEGMRSATQRIHWHHMPLLSIAWSPEGSTIYSGGAERVLVRSVLHHQGKATQQFIPRFTGSIERITVSQGGNTVVLVLSDNSVQILNSQMEVISTIRGLIRSKGGNRVGLKCDWDGVTGIMSRGTIWTNSLPGSIQCFRTSLRRALFSLDVTGLNLPPPEQGMEQKTGDVTQLAVGEDGWIVTVDAFHSSIFGLETNMKFWKFNAMTGKFELNTRVENPHSGEVFHLDIAKYRPEGFTSGTATSESNNSTMFAASVGADKQLKIWSLNDESTIYEEKVGWTCEFTGSHEDLPARSCAFSEDGTVVAVGFGRKLTGWTSVDGSLLFVEDLGGTAGGNDAQIMQILWGSKILEEESIVIARTGEQVSAWNCLDGTRLWNLDETVASMCRDRITGEIAIVQDTGVRMISASSDEPRLLVHANAADTVSSTFVPESSGLPIRGGVDTVEATQSRLYLLNKSQDLFCLCPSSEADRIARRGISDLDEEEEKQTAYTALVQNSTEEVEEMDIVDTLETHRSNMKLIEGPAYTQPPLKVLAPAFILSCLAPKPKN